MVQKALLSAQNQRTPENYLYPNGIVQFPKEEVIFYTQCIHYCHTQKNHAVNTLSNSIMSVRVHN